MIGTAGSAVKDHIDYSYDRDSNRTARTNQLSAAYSGVYSYDGLDRLIDADRNGVNLQSWNLDELGNWATTTIGSSIQTRYHNAANELLATSGTSWAGEAHDASGNMIICPKPGAESTATLSLTYDGWNRLIEVRANGVLVGTYEYDAAGRRIEKTAGGFTLDYFWNESYQNIETRKADDADPIEQWVFDIRYVDAPILRVYDGNTDGASDNTLYVNYDANFNVTAIVDAANGSVVERYAYTPYGARTVLDGSFGNPSTMSAYAFDRGHQGLAIDGESGLLYNRARYLHTSLGRFIQRDLMGYVDGADLYQYTRSSPSMSQDALGTQTYPRDRSTSNGWYWSLLSQGKPRYSVCRIFVTMVEDLALSQASWGELAGIWLPGKMLETGGGWPAWLIGIPKPVGFGWGGYGTGFEYVAGGTWRWNPNFDDWLGFSNYLRPNQHWNFAHFSGLVFAYTHSDPQVVRQIDEDLQQYKDAKQTNGKDLPERCAEIMVDLISLEFAIGLEGARAHARQTSPSGLQNISVRNAVVKFLREYDLGSKLCNGSRPCDCEEAVKRLQTIRLSYALRGVTK